MNVYKVYQKYQDETELARYRTSVPVLFKPSSSWTLLGYCGAATSKEALQAASLECNVPVELLFAHLVYRGETHE
jgi:hypothetical protein